MMETGISQEMPGPIFISALLIRLPISNTGAGNPELVYNVWRKQGDIAKYPYYPAKDDRGSLRSGGNSLYIEDGSFIRLSSLKLSWSLKPSLANRLLVKGLT